MRSLRTLKLCRNELEVFDPKFYPELRTLYLDENQIQSFSGVRRLRLLENFSARSQKGKTNINIHGLSELRKIYLSGTHSLFPCVRLRWTRLIVGIPISLRLERPFYNLQYLELAATKLTALPKDFASKVPNVRILNLSFNSLKDISPLKGLSLLKRLFLIGNRISSLGESTETFLSLTELQVLDLRYPPLPFPHPRFSWHLLTLDLIPLLCHSIPPWKPKSPITTRICSLSSRAKTPLAPGLHETNNSVPGCLDHGSCGGRRIMDLCIRRVRG